MITRDDALHHSPALWGLLSGLGAFGLIAAGTVVWNVVDHRDELRAWLHL